MSEYISNNGHDYLSTGIIDDIGIGLIDGHVGVYCSVYFGYDKDDDWKGVFAILYLNDNDNYIGHTYICLDKPEYLNHGCQFSLDSYLRDKLYRLLVEKQFYCMSGWEYCMKSIMHECEMRDISFEQYAMPDYTKIPVKEDGYLTRYEKMHCEKLDEHHSIDTDPIFYLEDGIYVVTVPLENPSPEGHYFKVVRVDMSNEEEYFDERDIISWCRISMERPEYITGYDENMTLTNDEIDRMIEKFEERYLDYFTENFESNWHRLVDLYDNDFSVSKANSTIDLELPMPDYTKLK